ncbi:MAG: CHAT domain-containing protein [Cyanobacteria bacterium J06633_8]
MRYFLGLFTFISVFLATFPVEAVFKDGFSVADQGVKIAQKQNIEKRKQEAERLYKLGKEQFEKGKSQEALKTFDKALAIYREIGDKKGENQTLLKIANIYSNFREYKNVFTNYQYFHTESVTHHYPILSEKYNFTTATYGSSMELFVNDEQDLLDYEKALIIYRKAEDKRGEYFTLYKIASNNLANYTKREYTNPLISYQQALAVNNQILDKQYIDKIAQGRIMYEIATIWYIQRKYSQALNYFQKSLGIFRKNQDNKGEAATLKKIAAIYEYEGKQKKEKIIKIYQEILAIYQTIGDKDNKYNILNKLASIYLELKDFPQAVKYYQQLLAVSKQNSNKVRELLALNQIGVIYHYLKDYSKALKYYHQALDVQIKNDYNYVELKIKKSHALFKIGEIYKAQGDNKRALIYYQQALNIHQKLNNYYQKLFIYQKTKFRHPKQGRDEGFIFASIGDILKIQNQPKLAIVFFKKSVQIFEEHRNLNLKLLDDAKQAQDKDSFKKSEESHTKILAPIYRSLADLLIQQDRILEAQQVLDLLKVRELKDYLRDVRGSGEELVILRPEKEILQKYNELQTSAIALGQELIKLRKIPESRRTRTQNQRIAELVKIQTEFNQQFNEFIESKQVVALLDQLNRKAYEMTVKLTDLDALRDDLKRLDAVMLYPLILEDRLELILTTPDSPPLRRTVKVKSKELNHTIVEFRQALQNPTSDAKAPAQKLYNWLIKPLENELKKSQAETIIYAPDGQLRYIPLAALHDGKQWLIEKYRVNNITAKSLTDFTAKPQSQNKVLAGAFVKGNYNIQVDGRNYPFRGLTYAGKEVENLTKVLPKTTKLIDKEFSKDGTTVKMNEYNIVHLATHAAFVTGNASLSFILFGDGKIANLKEIGNWTLNNVDLVVLSACETGIGGFGNGEEILGLGYQFQSRGARATIASLWQVSDGGTQVLMNAFYNALQGKMTKAEALRQAQIALINDDYTAVGGERGIIKVVSNNASNSKQVSDKLKHPYYWAPFILIGNGL